MCVPRCTAIKKWGCQVVPWRTGALWVENPLTAVAMPHIPKWERPDPDFKYTLIIQTVGSFLTGFDFQDDPFSMEGPAHGGMGVWWKKPLSSLPPYIGRWVLGFFIMKI